MKLITYSVDLFEIVSQNNWGCDLQDELKGRALSDVRITHEEGVDSDLNVAGLILVCTGWIALSRWIPTLV